MKQELELCKPHDIDLLNPQIITTWTMEKVGGNTKYIDKSKLVYMESRVIYFDRFLLNSNNKSNVFLLEISAIQINRIII